MALAGCELIKRHANTTTQARRALPPSEIHEIMQQLDPQSQQQQLVADRESDIADAKRIITKATLFHLMTCVMSLMNIPASWVYTVISSPVQLAYICSLITLPLLAVSLFSSRSDRQMVHRATLVLDIVIVLIDISSLVCLLPRGPFMAFLFVFAGLMYAILSLTVRHGLSQ